jgi:hypothetical protein
MLANLSSGGGGEGEEKMPDSSNASQSPALIPFISFVKRLRMIEKNRDQIIVKSDKQQKKIRIREVFLIGVENCGKFRDTGVVVLFGQSEIQFR